VNAQNEQDNTALQLAAENENIEATEALLQNSNINIQTVIFRSFLFLNYIKNILYFTLEF
jgi:ankyrin repeat protein